MADPPPVRRPRILALDVGKKRIGLAITDELGLMAHGLPSLERTKPREDTARLTALAREHKVALLLIGLPVRLGGEESQMTAHVREFAARLEARSGLPVQFRDERLTSVEAEAVLSSAGKRPKRSSGEIDRVAAILILEDYLASQFPSRTSWPESVDPQRD